MGGAQHHARRLARFEFLLPARRAQAPAVARFETRKAELGHRRGQIVAARFGEFQEGSSHHHAHRVAAEILAPGIAAAIAVKSRRRAERAKLERFAEHVLCRYAAAVTAPVVPQHASLQRPPVAQLRAAPLPCRLRLRLGEAFGQHAAAAASAAFEASDKSGDRAVWLDAVRRKVAGAQDSLMPAMQAAHHNCVAALHARLRLRRCSFPLCGLRYATRPAGTQLDHDQHIAMNGAGIESAFGTRRLPDRPRVRRLGQPPPSPRAAPTWSDYAGRSDTPTRQKGFGPTTNCQMPASFVYKIEQTRLHLLNQTTPD